MITKVDRWRRLVAPLALLTSLVALAAAQSDTYTHSLRSDRVDGVHEDLAAVLEPVGVGPVTVRLTSPSHSLEVLEHELSLGPGADGSDAASLRARYQGRAHLVAELEVGGVTSEIEDDIVLPLQETELAGRVEIAKVEGGYRIVALEAPSHVEIRVESDLAGRLGLLCRGFAVLAMGNVDCDAVDRAMSVVRVPLPEPGEEFLVEGQDLTKHERRQIERYLRERSN
jgi:hypothetical protein